MVRNRFSEENTDVGVYCLPCLECPASYLGETGRKLGIRLEEHKNACRLGKDYSAVVAHSLGAGHRIGFNEAKLVYKCQDRSIRRLVEGALISLNKTFDHNTSATKEDRIVNSLICHSLDIKNYCNIRATICTAAASPQSPHVTGVPTPPSATDGTDAYPEVPSIPPEPPDRVPVPTSPIHNNHNQLRRSERIGGRNNQ